MQKMSRKEILILIGSIILLGVSLYVSGHFFLECIGSGVGGYGIGWFLRRFKEKKL